MGKKHPKRPGKYIKEQRLLLHVTSSSTGRPKKVHFTVGPRRGGSKGNNTGLTETAAVPNPHVDLQHDEQPPQEDPQPAPSRYSLHKQREINAWKDVREPIFRTSLKLSGPLSNTCSICRKEHTEDMSLYRWRLRFVHINFCKCEPELVSLVRYGLWGASENPQTAFAVSLLEWLVILGNECHVSVNSLYRSLVGEPISEFRQFFYRKSTLTDLSPSLDDGTICPACPKQNGEQTILLDGNFGLVRKASSGTSIVPPHHGSRLFLEDEVDCNHFQAGSKIRSTNRQEKLDVSGMFGSSCRHEMPIRFVNMSRGESLGYPVLLIQQLVQQAQLKNIRLRVVYDIGCVLEAHLKHQEERGLGLTDGEGMERIWSHLRPFYRITKEMTPSHRIDLLTDAALHYARRKATDIEAALLQRMDKAGKMQALSEENICEVVKQAPGLHWLETLTAYILQVEFER
ncbi:hypothetical protein Bbelb_386340 [Branchiostoma belcheri]|nr:hypothetical protein Bbelb_386340 [Branchiostoma belcheri]